MSEVSLVRCAHRSGTLATVTRPKSSAVHERHVLLAVRVTRQPGLPPLSGPGPPLSPLPVWVSSYLSESSYVARIFAMSRQSQPQNDAEDHDNAPQAAAFLMGLHRATEGPLLNRSDCVRAGFLFLEPLNQSRARSNLQKR